MALIVTFEDAPQHRWIGRMLCKMSIALRGIECAQLPGKCCVEVLSEEDGSVVAVLDPSDACGDGYCGGCGNCMLRQAWHYGQPTREGYL